MSAVGRLEEWLRRQSKMPYAIAVEADPMEAALRGIGYDEWCETHPFDPVLLVGYMVGEAAVIDCGGTVSWADKETVNEQACGAIFRHAGLTDHMVTAYMPEAVAECMRRSMWLVEDCTGEYGGYIGQFGNASVWRYPVGGVVVTCDPGINERVRRKVTLMSEDTAIAALRVMGDLL